MTDGSVRCTGIAVCDDSGEPRTAFQQGESAHFFVEFEVIRDIQVPAVGLLLTSESGLVVHGKNSFQCVSPVPYNVPSGSKIQQHQHVALQISPGKYDFTVGLAGADPQAYKGYSQGDLSHIAFNDAIRTHCRAVNAGSLEVDFAADGKLSHHGVADLPGFASLKVIEDASVDRAVELQPDPMPPVFHVTHWKAGSQWIHKILRKCVPERIVDPQLGAAQVRQFAIRRGAVYPTVYLTQKELAKLAPPDSKRFVVIRDLRDTLVSAYFSLKHSHPLVAESMVALRKKLTELDFEAGLLHLMDDFLPHCATIQLSWIEAGEPILKYEELLNDDLAQLEHVLIERCGLPIGPEQLRAAVLENRFETVTQGRKPGTEEIMAHERKGVAGDWRNHFSARVKDAFKTRYGGLLVAAGYEKDLHW